jgi:hypothetical protein
LFSFIGAGTAWVSGAFSFSSWEATYSTFTNRNVSTNEIMKGEKNDNENGEKIMNMGEEIVKVGEKRDSQRKIRGTWQVVHLLD